MEELKFLQDQPSVQWPSVFPPLQLLMYHLTINVLLVVFIRIKTQEHSHQQLVRNTMVVLPIHRTSWLLSSPRIQIRPKTCKVPETLESEIQQEPLPVVLQWATDLALPHSQMAWCSSKLYNVKLQYRLKISQLTSHSCQQVCIKQVTMIVKWGLHPCSNQHLINN